MRLPLLLLLATAAAPLQGQASPYIPLDDPRLPLFEHLVARGEVRDPTPLVRPFRARQALGALAEADTLNAPSRRLIQELRAAWVQDTALAAWALEARLGGDAYTDVRRDPLHLDGHEGAGGYFELRGEGRFGPLLVVSRPVVEQRLSDDPDWRGRKDLVVVGRMAEGYVSGQWRYGSFFLGQIDRQWGPDGVPGLPLSPIAYPRDEVAFEIGVDRLSLQAHAAQLTDELDSLGATVHRYWFAHRLALRPSKRLALALWETTVIGGPDREFDGRWRNPAAVLLLSNTYGLGYHEGNVAVGADVAWWAHPSLRLEGQLHIDDLNYPESGTNDHTPSRVAFTAKASGPAGTSWSWSALYTLASSLEFQTFFPAEAYADAGVGLGRAAPSHDQFTLRLARPLRASWLLSPELTVRRQGDRRLTDPWPPEAESGGVSPVFVGTVETTYRAALGVSGAYGPLRAAGEVGVHYLVNVDHDQGATDVRPVARLRVTVGLGSSGTLP